MEEDSDDDFAAAKKKAPPKRAAPAQPKLVQSKLVQPTKKVDTKDTPDKAAMKPSAPITAAARASKDDNEDEDFPTLSLFDRLNAKVAAVPATSAFAAAQAKPKPAPAAKKAVPTKSTKPSAKKVRSCLRGGVVRLAALAVRLCWPLLLQWLSRKRSGTEAKIWLPPSSHQSNCGVHGTGAPQAALRASSTLTLCATMAGEGRQR